MVKERQIINTNIRLNLLDDADRQAWEYLQHMDRTQYKSYTRAVVAALNGYFGHMAKIEDDPYLETRAKEDEFLQRVMDAVEKGIDRTVTEKMLSMPMSRNMPSLEEKLEFALEKAVAEQLPAVVKETVESAVRDSVRQALKSMLQELDTVNEAAD